MTDSHDDFGHDDELRDMLRAIDPASSLSSADPAGVARLLEDTMSGDLIHETRETGTHGRGPLTWVVAAAATVVIAGVGLFGYLSQRGDDDVSTAHDPAVSASSDATVTTLQAPAGSAGRCMVPSAEILANQALAFKGTVQEISDGSVVLDPSTFFVGDATDLVEVQAPSADMQALIGAVDFQEGQTYLVSATDGRVTVCGFSGPVTPELTALYAEAFPR